MNRFYKRFYLRARTISFTESDSSSEDGFITTSDTEGSDDLSF
jgi:hypothetical protein